MHKGGLDVSANLIIHAVTLLHHASRRQTRDSERNVGITWRVFPSFFSFFPGRVFRMPNFGIQYLATRTDFVATICATDAASAYAYGEVIFLIKNSPSPDGRQSSPANWNSRRKNILEIISGAEHRPRFAARSFHANVFHLIPCSAFIVLRVVAVDDFCLDLNLRLHAQKYNVKISKTRETRDELCTYIYWRKITSNVKHPIEFYIKFNKYLKSKNIHHDVRAIKIIEKVCVK